MIRVKVQFPNYDKQRHYRLENNYIRDFPNQSWTRLDKFSVVHIPNADNQSINDFPDHDKQRHYDLQNNYIRDFPNHDKQSWTRLGRLIV